MTTSLLNQIVRLAHSHPDLRDDLLPLLKEAKDYQTYVKKKQRAGERALSRKDWETRIKGLGKPKTEQKSRPDSDDDDDLHPKHREAIKEYNLEIVGPDVKQAVEIATKVRKGISESADICELSPKICKGNLGLTRDKMPQIVGDKSVKALLASSSPKDKAMGEAMVAAGANPKDVLPVLKQLIKHFADNGVTAKKSEMQVGKLKATQKEIKATKTFQMADAHLKGKFKDIDDSVIVSRDGHILDGHHRWAALLTIDPKRKMNVTVIDMDMDDLLKEAAAFPGVFKADFKGSPLPSDAQKKYKSKAKSKFKN